MAHSNTYRYALNAWSIPTILPPAPALPALNAEKRATMRVALIIPNFLPTRSLMYPNESIPTTVPANAKEESMVP